MFCLISEALQVAFDQRPTKSWNLYIYRHARLLKPLVCGNDCVGSPKFIYLYIYIYILFLPLGCPTALPALDWQPARCTRSKSERSSTTRMRSKGFWFPFISVKKTGTNSVNRKCVFCFSCPREKKTHLISYYKVSNVHAVHDV